MRFIPSCCIKEGMIVGKPIYNKNGNLLLEKGVKLKQEYLEKLMELKVNGIYIDDELSRDIEIESIVSEEIKAELIQGVKNMFNHAVEDKNAALDSQISRMINSVNKIIDEIVYNEDLMVSLIDIKSLDDYTYSHSVNVAVLSLIMGVALKLNNVQLYELGIGALLHDIGKAFIPDEIINKPARLTDDEMEVVQKHSQLGYEYMKQSSVIPYNSQVAILEHHEKYDGTGYPHKKEGEQISLYGRIIAISDVYDALTSSRSYKDAMSPSDAMEYILGSSDTHFDFKLVQLFYRNIATYPVGSIAILNDDRKCIILKNYPELPNRPTVRILNTEEIIKLSSTINNLNITILKLL